MFLEPENIGVTVGIVFICYNLRDVDKTSLCVGHLGIQYGGHHSDI